jgi:hypothetical protein
MKGKKTPKVYDRSMMLLTWNRERRPTTHPRMGVRVSSAASDVDVSIPASL